MKAYKIRVLKPVTRGGPVSDRIRANIGKEFVVTEAGFTKRTDGKPGIITIYLDGIETKVLSREYEIIGEINEGEQV
jgi:hypothetical protein